MGHDDYQSRIDLDVQHRNDRWDRIDEEKAAKIRSEERDAALKSLYAQQKQEREQENFEDKSGIGKELQFFRAIKAATAEVITATFAQCRDRIVKRLKNDQDLMKTLRDNLTIVLPALRATDDASRELVNSIMADIREAQKDLTGQKEKRANLIDLYRLWEELHHLRVMLFEMWARKNSP